VSEAALWMERARGLRALQDMLGAEAAIVRAGDAAPGDRLVAFLRAQSAYELGRPAAALFARARGLWPENRDLVRNQALALASEGDFAGAEGLLTDRLRGAPDWLDGQRVLAALRFTHGVADFDAGYAAAVTAMPGHAGLWLAWFSARAQVRDWARAGAILYRAAGALGETRAIAIARAFVASESGAVDEARRRLAGLADVADDFLAICRIRTALRGGDVGLARDLALPLTTTPMARQVWPYLSTCWRLLGDARAQWLDGDPALVGAIDVGFSAGELAALAGVLRGLHTAALPYAEQSVRGGTQTDRSVLLRHEPVLIDARQRLMAAVRGFVDGLPAVDPGHPFLGRARGDLRVAGSWSVRLAGGGFNVAHTHPAGWLSSAFYVALPEDAGDAPAGHFHYGAPPAELGLDLAPYATMAPRAGMLVLFPSLMWHGTVPFAGGERLNIAFDVVPATG